MSTHLITGYAGHGHIKASDQGSFNAALLGNGEFVLERGEQLRCTVVSNNCIRIYDGDIMMQGRHIIVDRDTYEDTVHSNGTAGYKRIDLIVMTYTKDTATGIETAGIEVIEGTPVTGTPTLPEYITGDIVNGGASKNQMPLYKVTIDGLNMGTPVKLFKTVSTLESMKEELEGHIREKAEELGENLYPIVSDLDEATLIQNYGEFVADAKMVGEIAQSFQAGCNTIVAGCTTYGETPASNSPSDIVAAIKQIHSERYNAGVSATKKGTAAAADVLSGKTFTNASGVGLSGSMADKTGTAAVSATPTLDATNSRLKMSIPAVGKYGTSNFLYAAYSTIANLIGLTAAKIVKGNTILGVAGTTASGKVYKGTHSQPTGQWGTTVTFTITSAVSWYKDVTHYAAYLKSQTASDAGALKSCSYSYNASTGTFTVTFDTSLKAPVIEYMVAAIK